MMDGWRSILGPMPTFPRDVLVQIPGAKIVEGREWEENGKFQVSCRNLESYTQSVVEYAARRDMWVGWSQANMYEAMEMDWLYGDIDAPDLEDSLTMARKYEEECMDTFGVQPAVLFSCGKGFHMHFTHGAVPYRGRAYADAVKEVVSTDLDLAPLKHRKAKPRIPYTINLKASQRELAPMYVVPVDLSWDLEEMVHRAKACEAMAFEVPYSHSAAKIVGERAERIEEGLQAARRRPRDHEREREVVQQALAFCKRSGPFLVDKHGRPDGRKRLMYSMLVPALMHEHGGDEAMVLVDVEDFVLDSGASWGKYHPYARQCIQNCIMPDGTMRLPMGLKRWISENPGLKWTR